MKGLSFIFFIWLVIFMYVYVLSNGVFVSCSVCQLFSTNILLCTTRNCTNADSGVYDRMGAYFRIIFNQKYERWLTIL